MIHFVGAGPGAADLITVRGARLLSEADVVVYAGSLVNPELLELCKEGCVVYDSARMTLEEIVDVLAQADAHGLECMRLHTGDPALYGAHGEQMAELARRGVAYDVVPGVSSLFGAAAALGCEFTVPGGSQSLVVTRMPGRTSVPEAERLSALAAHGSTVALFLSAAHLREAQRELLAAGRDASTPAAIVVRATWPDEQVWRCTVGTLAQCAEEHDVRKTALVVIGECLEGGGRSRLYDAGFSHEYRKARAASGDKVFKQPKGVYPLWVRQGGMRVRCIAFTRAGAELAQRVCAGLEEQGHVAQAFASERVARECGLAPAGELDAWVTDAFDQADALLFVGACGIAVRAIASHVRDKMHDPAVVCVDEAGRFAVPVLSGHVGGGNKLAREVATLCGGQAVVTTATDVRGVFAVDEWAARQGLAILDREEAKRVSAELLEGRTVGFASDFVVHGTLPAGLVAVDVDAREGAGEGAARHEGLLNSNNPIERSDPSTKHDEMPQTGVLVSLDERKMPFAYTLRLVPRSVVVGVGCRRGVSVDAVRELVDACLAEAHVAVEAVRALATIDLKADEEALVSLARERGWELATFSAAELEAVPGTFAESAFVRQTVGVGNVCERAACALGGTLLLGRRSSHEVTVALAAMPCELAFVGEKDDAGERMGRAVESSRAGETGEEGAATAVRPGVVTCVGLGPGAGADLTQRAREALGAAEVIVGYTTYVNLVRQDYPQAAFATTGMRGEVKRCREALARAAEGKRVAVVCSGDPGVYGMAGLLLELASEYPGVAVEVVPGVTAANGGAALLGAPLMHDWCTISLSDLMTPWEQIAARLHAAAEAGLVICLYNPASHGRPDHLRRACAVLREVLPDTTVCGISRNVGRVGETSEVLSLAELAEAKVDMTSCVFVGNAQTRVVDGRMVTPRGYDDPLGILPFGSAI